MLAEAETRRDVWGRRFRPLHLEAEVKAVRRLRGQSAGDGGYSGYGGYTVTTRYTGYKRLQAVTGCYTPLHRKSCPPRPHPRSGPQAQPHTHRSPPSCTQIVLPQPHQPLPPAAHTPRALPGTTRGVPQNLQVGVWAGRQGVYRLPRDSDRVQGERADDGAA